MRYKLATRSCAESAAQTDRLEPFCISDRVSEGWALIMNQSQSILVVGLMGTRLSFVFGWPAITEIWPGLQKVNWAISTTGHRTRAPIQGGQWLRVWPRLFVNRIFIGLNGHSFFMVRYTMIIDFELLMDIIALKLSHVNKLLLHSIYNRVV